MIGFVNDVETIDNAIEIGYAIHSDYHNRSYATEMFRAVIHALLSFGYASVVAGAFEQNQASIRVMQKCGMTQTDREEEILYHGKRMRCMYFSINAPK